MADGISGDTIVIQYLFPNSTTPFCCNTSGPNSVTGVVTASGVSLTVNNSAQITVFNNSVQMLEILQPFGSKFQAASFNGVSIQDLTNPSAFTGFSVNPATTVAGFNISDVSISGGLLFINFQNLTVPLNSLIQVRLYDRGSDHLSARTEHLGVACRWVARARRFYAEEVSLSSTRGRAAGLISNADFFARACDPRPFLELSG